MANIPYEAWLILKKAGLTGKKIYVPKYHPEDRERRRNREEEYLTSLMRRLAQGERLSAALVKGETGFSWPKARALLREARRRLELMRERGLDPAEVFGLSE